MSTLFAVRTLIANNISLAPIMGMEAHGISTQSIISLFEIQFLDKHYGLLLLLLLLLFLFWEGLKRKKPQRHITFVKSPFLSTFQWFFFSRFGSVNFFSPVIKPDNLYNTFSVEFCLFAESKRWFQNKRNKILGIDLKC